MSLWKYSFELVTRELEVTKKKRQALDNLFTSNKISQSTYDYLESELAKAIAELEDHLKTLMNKMTERAKELEKQISTLELFLASLEIHHAVGDIDDEIYGQQNDAILLGLEATRQELNSINRSLSEDISEPVEKPAEQPEPVEVATEAVEAMESEEIEKEEEPQAEEPPTYEPVESTEPSQEAPKWSAVTEPAESEDSPPMSNSEEPSEPSSPESESTIEY